MLKVCEGGSHATQWRRMTPAGVCYTQRQSAATDMRERSRRMYPMTTIMPAWGEVFEIPPSTTADDLLRLPDDGSKYELFEGKLVREMTSPGHGDICHRLSGVLFVY